METMVEMTVSSNFLKSQEDPSRIWGRPQQAEVERVIVVANLRCPVYTKRKPARKSRANP